MTATVTLVGNITRDPELRFTPSGFPRATFGLAVNRVRTDRNTNEKVEETSYFNVVLLGTLAENAAHSLSKGGRVIVHGRLEQRSWETQEGEKRTTVEVIADDLGPSLRWATASVERNSRSSGEGPGGGGRPVSNAPDTIDSGEEPF